MAEHHVEWGRADRGRLWHLIRVSHWRDGEGTEEITYCDLGRPIVNVTLGQPPFGGPVCDRCEDAVRALVEAARNARLPSLERRALLATDE